ncbi:MAG: extracytoplasmic binding receptor [Hyphomicrobiales bacterium]|nr:extracytoplasmic binding receptor [Hyphomicrobiales bacterium]
MLRCFSAILAFAALVPFAHAQENAASYPSRGIRLIVPLPAGGGVDTVARILAERLQQKWSQPVVVENRPGAGGNIGAEFVSRAAPDGYTLLVTAPGPLVVNSVLYKSLRYDPGKFEPVTIISNSPNVLAVPPSSPFKTARELLDYAKSNPGKLNYASQGIGSTSHLTTSWLQQVLKSELVHVPYGGTAPALNDLAAGHVDLMIADLGSVLPLAEGGNLRILAATTAKPVASIPNVPTLLSLGLEDFISETWFAIAAPEKTPADVAQRMSAAVREVVTSPDVRARMDAMSVSPLGSSPADMTKIVRDESTRWQKVARDGNVKID